jgi:hypothetical protein
LKRQDLKSLCSVLFISLVLATTGMCESVWLSDQPQANATGFSIFGLKCGMSLQGILNRLPLHWKVDAVTPQEIYSLQDRKGRVVLVYVDKVKQRVTSLSIFPLTEAASVELDGKPAIRFGDSKNDIVRRIGPLKQVSRHEFKVNKGAQDLTLEFDPKGPLLSVNLSPSK